LNEFEIKGMKMTVNEAKPERDRNSAGSRKSFSGRRR